MGNGDLQRKEIVRAMQPMFSDAAWRLRHLYYIKTAAAEVILFKPNWVQEKILDEMWYQNVILKSRRLGCTTLIVLFMLDACLHNSNVRAGIIADTDAKAMEIFRDKVLFAYDRLPQAMRQARSKVVDSAHTLEFDNGSSIHAGTSVRGLAMQYLLVSELGTIAAENPAKADEIRTGAFNTLQAEQFLFVESTAKGREGLFYELVEIARQDQAMKRGLTNFALKFHFYGWFLDDACVLPAEQARSITLTKEDQVYFAKVEKQMEIDLTDEQKAWYVEKRRTQKDEMKAEFPSTPDEPFEVSGESRVFRHEMMKVRTEGRILQRIPIVPNIPVNMFFDIGGASTRVGADKMAIWFHQRVGPENRLIRYYENSGYGLEHYVNYVRSHGYLLGKFYLPHDAAHKRLTTRDAGKSVEDMFYEMGLRGTDVVVVEQVENKWHDGIGSTRAFLATCLFDEGNCDQGIKRLEGYKKTWNEQLACWRDEPAHDDASHGADALETGARGYNPPATTARPKSGGRRRNWRTT